MKTIKLYYSDSATPVELTDVKLFFSEGGLLRIIREKKECWVPLCQVHRIECEDHL